MNQQNFLADIIESKEAEIDQARKTVTETQLREAALARRDYRPFFARLRQVHPGRVNIIAEIKRASPSRGPIRPDLDAGKQARAYERGGAAALSVLTDRPYFMGSASDLREARSATALPVLRKDFVIHEYQLYESAAMGADAVLLIVRVLGKGRLPEFLEICRTLGMDALVEIHTEADLEIAIGARARLIGINNRNLESFHTDLSVTLEMAGRLDPETTPVAASGIEKPEDIRALASAGIRNFLIGEHLARASDPAKRVAELVHATAPAEGGPPVLRR